MHLVGMHFRTERRVHPLVALDQALALKLGRHNGGVPMAAITLQRNMFARQALCNDGLKFFGSHERIL